MISEFLLSLLLLVPQVFPASQGTPAEFLPEHSEVEGWATHRSQQHFAGEDLYEYINGGAEIYHEYGFVQVVVQDYISDDGKSVSIEIYEMASPAGAFGMYTFKTSAEGQRISVGNDSQIADYYVNFWKGDFLVTLTGFDETAETRKGLIRLAESVGSKIPAGGEKPPILSLLPEEDLLGTSLKYFTGFLGLRSSYPFFNLSILGYEEGIKGEYTGGFGFFLFRFGGEQEARRAFRSVIDQEDSRERKFFAATHREFLMLVIGKTDTARADRIFERTKRRIRD
jgi:hypothetical protein